VWVFKGGSTQRFLPMLRGDRGEEILEEGMESLPSMVTRMRSAKMGVRGQGPLKARAKKKNGQGRWIRSTRRARQDGLTGRGNYKADGQLHEDGNWAKRKLDYKTNLQEGGG